MIRWLLPLLALGCARPVICPDPEIGQITPRDCAQEARRSAALRDPLRAAAPEALGHFEAWQREAATQCAAYNACQVRPSDAERARGERHLQLHTIEATLARRPRDAAARRALCAHLSQTLSGTAEAQRDPFRSVHTAWLGAQSAPPMPALPPGVPALSTWASTARAGRDQHGFAVVLRFRGVVAKADDVARVTLPDGRSAQCPVKRLPEGPERGAGGTAHCVFPEAHHWPTDGEMVVHYQPRQAGAATRLGAVPLGAEARLSAAWLAYLPTPIQRLPVTHERLWLVLRRPEPPAANVTLRCAHAGHPLGLVLRGQSALRHDADGLRRYHFALPVAVPRAPGDLRATADDLLPAEAAGPWSCTASVSGRPVRTLAFTLGPDGRPALTLPEGGVRPPWWPL